MKYLPHLQKRVLHLKKPRKELRLVFTLRVKDQRALEPEKRLSRIQGVNLTKKKLTLLKLEKGQKMVLLGTLLGDGSLGVYKGYANARFQMRHSCKQEEYFYWKATVLQDLASDKAIHKQKSDGFQREGWKLHFQTRALPVLTELSTIINKRGKKLVKRDWLNHLNAQALAVWWCDDGSLIKNRKNGVFCTQGFSVSENLVLAKYLKVVWGVKVTVAKVKYDYKGVVSYKPVLRLNTVNLQKFLQIILPFIPVSSMVYKVCIGYVDTKLQQRWISEIKAALPPFSAEVEAVYALFRKEREARLQRMI